MASSKKLICTVYKHVYIKGANINKAEAPNLGLLLYY